VEKLHENAERYYQPLLSAASGFLARRLVGKPEAAFYYLTGFFGHMWGLFREKGGFYFKDRRGEELAQGCWTTIIRWAKGLAGEHVYSGCLDEIERFESLMAFHGRCVPATNLWILRDALIRKWDDEETRQATAAMEILYLILDYEMNAIYELWYGRPEPFPFRKLWVLRGCGGEWLAAELELYLRARSWRYWSARFDDWSYGRRFGQTKTVKGRPWRPRWNVW